MKHPPVIPVNRRSNLPITEPPEIRFDVMVVLDKCFMDEEGDVVDEKTIEHEVLGSYETEDEAFEFMALLSGGKQKNEIDRKEAVAALLFDSEVWDEEESPRPSEEAVHKLAEELIEFFDNQETTQERNAEIEASTPEEEREIQNDPEFT